MGWFNSCYIEVLFLRSMGDSLFMGSPVSLGEACLLGFFTQIISSPMSFYAIFCSFNNNFLDNFSFFLSIFFYYFNKFCSFSSIFSKFSAFFLDIFSFYIFFSSFSWQFSSFFFLFFDIFLVSGTLKSSLVFNYCNFMKLAYSRSFIYLNSRFCCSAD